jgi:large subunit ribosomal protein L13
MAKKGSVHQGWHLIDATDQVVGRLAVRIATILRGKHRPEYTPHVDTGEFIIVINAEKVRFTGKKLQTKMYQAYSHYPGGLKEVSARDMLAEHPERGYVGEPAHWQFLAKAGRRAGKQLGAPA